MGINLQANATAAQLLSQINSMARSTTGSIAGSMGMIGNHVIKFNTHWTERLFSSTTSEMLDASNAMRSKLKSLIGEILGGNQKKFDELCQKIDGKGAQSLLDRKVVADVIKQVETAANINLTEGDAQVAQHSSAGLDTTFGTVKDIANHAIEAQARALREANRAEVQKLATDMVQQIKTNCNMQPGELQKFEELTAEFMDELMHIPNHDPDNSQDVIEIGIGMAARFAMGGRGLTAGGLVSSDMMKRCHGAHTSCFMNMNKGDEAFAMRLLVYCDFETANILMCDKEDFKQEPLTSKSIYTALAGKAPSDDIDFDSLTPHKLRMKLTDAQNEGFMRVMMRLQPGKIAGAYANLTSGTSGVLVSKKLAEQIQCDAADDGIHVQMNDLKTTGPGYDLSDAKRIGYEGVSRIVKTDIFRNSGVFDFGDETVDCRGLKEENAGPIHDQVMAKLEKLCGGKTDQMLVVGLLMTQAGQSLAQAFPVIGTDSADHTSMTFKLEKNDQDGSIKVKISNNLISKNDPTLSYTYEVKANGENTLVDFDYKVTSPAETAEPFIGKVSEKPANLVSLINEKGSEAEKAGLANFKTGDLVNEKNVMTMVTRFQKAMPDATPAAIKSMSRQVFNFFAEIRLRQALKGMEVSTFEQLSEKYTPDDEALRCFMYRADDKAFTDIKALMNNSIKAELKKLGTSSDREVYDKTGVLSLTLREFRPNAFKINGETVPNKPSGKEVRVGDHVLTEKELLCESERNRPGAGLHEVLINNFPDTKTRTLVSLMFSMAYGVGGFFTDAFETFETIKTLGNDSGDSKFAKYTMKMMGAGGRDMFVCANDTATKGFFDVRIAADGKITMVVDRDEGFTANGGDTDELKLEADGKGSFEMSVARDHFRAVITIDPSQRDADGYPIFTVDKLENVEID